MFKQLQERRLVQILISYLAAGFVTLEVVNQFVERNVLPETVYYVALIWYLLGIPAAVLIGWHHGEKGRQQAPRSEIAVLALLAVGAVVLSGFTVVRLNAPEVDLAAMGPNPNRLAVLYFDDYTAAEDNRHVATGLTEALIDQLSSVQALDVISRHGVAPFRDSDVPRDSIGRALDAGTLVGGSIERAGDRLRVNLQLYDGASGAPLPDGRVALEPRHPDSLMQLVEEVGEEASRLLRAKLGAQVGIVRASAETNTTAWTLLQRAESLKREADHQAAHGDEDAAFATYDRAHETLVNAARADTGWVKPAVLHAGIQFARSRLLASHPRDAAREAARGIEYAELALAREPRSPEALAARGTLRYWTWLLNVTSDPDQQDQLLEQGREDLLRAVERDPGLATAQSTLSHLYYQTGSISQGLLAAQRAYDADAYLDAAVQIVWNLYTGHYDLENWRDAQKWCDVGLDRFPDVSSFRICPVDLMVAGVLAPGPDSAWNLVRSASEAADHSTRDFEEIYNTMSVAGVLARAGMQDSARVLLDRTADRISPEVDRDNDLRWHYARMLILTDQHDRAIDQLTRLIAADPSHAFGRGGEIGWAYRPLISHPRFDELRRSGPADH